jgi:hypothetical protein
MARLRLELWDDDGWNAFSNRQVKLARDAGTLTELAPALHGLAGQRLFGGAFATAAELLDQTDSMSDATGSPRSDRLSSTYRAARQTAAGLRSHRSHGSGRNAAR